MGVFESKIKDMSLSDAFGSFPTGISQEKAEELWKRYDEDGDGSLSKDEAKHMVIDLAELTVEWAKTNIEHIMAEATEDGDDTDTQKLKAENEQNIDAAYKMMKDESVIKQILVDFDTDGDGQISKAEFVAKACEGYNLFRPVKKAKTTAVHVHEMATANGAERIIRKEVVGSNVHVSVDGYSVAGAAPPCCQATISPHGLVCVSAQTGILPGKGALVSGGVGPETKQCLENIRVILNACGLGVENLLKVTVYLKDNDENEEPGGRLHEMSKAYRSFCPNRLPALTTVSSRVDICGALAGDAQVEIEAQASV